MYMQHTVVHVFKFLLRLQKLYLGIILKLSFLPIEKIVFGIWSMKQKLIQLLQYKCIWCSMSLAPVPSQRADTEAKLSSPQISSISLQQKDEGRKEGFSTAPIIFIMGKDKIGHVNAIPTMHYLTGIPRNTQPNNFFIYNRDF